MTVARVLFPLPLPEPFDYLVPDHLDVRAGSYVRAPLGRQERTGVVWALGPQSDAEGRELKSLIDVFPTPEMSADMRAFVDFAARYTVAAPGQILAMTLRARGGLRPSPVATVYRASDTLPGRMTPARESVLEAARDGALTASELAQKAGVSASVVRAFAQAGGLLAEECPVDRPFPEPDPSRPGLVLSSEQAAAGRALTKAVEQGGFAPFLLDGVTGSGKTEVYFEAIAAALKAAPDGQVLVLLPEIALTQAVLERFEQRFGAPPAAWHSGLGETARRRTWREVAHGRARIVIGARSALFLPFHKLALIIVDEEHDGSYKQEEGVSYQARDMAVMRAKLCGAGIVLASATPALESTVNAETGRYGYLRLSARPGAARLPTIELVDMRSTPPERGNWLSPRLAREMQAVFEAGEQSLLFLNRRGYAPLVICRACGEKLKCPGTDSWLTEHRYTGRLVCHLTGWSMPKPATCPHCKAENTLMGVGPGVERVAEEARRLLPDARIGIFSSDTARSGEETRLIVERMAAGEIDVLIGTQIVAKGHNFPGLTLVGVVDADSGMKGGDLRAGERTFQLLSQVAGRAGRAEKPGRALIQTYDTANPAMIALSHGDRDGFLRVERDVRAQMGMPPFGRLAAMIVSAATAEAADEAARLALSSAPNGRNVEIFGPAPAPIAVLRGRHRRRFLIRSPREVDLSAFMAGWRARLKYSASVRVSVDIDPYSFL